MNPLLLIGLAVGGVYLLTRKSTPSYGPGTKYTDAMAYYSDPSKQSRAFKLALATKLEIETAYNAGRMTKEAAREAMEKMYATLKANGSLSDTELLIIMK